MWAKNKQKFGFTIVELLIVVVVIAILAAITIVSYNGIQSKANDARSRTIASQITKAVMLWNVDSSLAPKGGWSSTVAYDGTNCSDGTGGWIFAGAYTCSLENILVGKRLIPSGLTLGAPRNTAFGTANDGRYSFMFYPCTGTDRFALYWSLQNPSNDDAANLASVEASGCTSGPRTNYGMRAASLIQL